MDDILGVPRQLSGQMLDAALHYAQERRWDMLPGAWLEFAEGGAPRCSCGSAVCPSPGAHPTGPDWADRASGGAGAMRRMWGREPHASVLLPTGRAFDVVEVPEGPGFLALARIERLGLPLGPVAHTPVRRMAFLVLPGASVKAPELLLRLGRSSQPPDLAVRGEGDWIAAPPTRMGSGGRVQWARRPTELNRWLPDAEDLLGVLAYACGTDAAPARGR